MGTDGGRQALPKLSHPGAFTKKVFMSKAVFNYLLVPVAALFFTGLARANPTEVPVTAQSEYGTTPSSPAAFADPRPIEVFLKAAIQPLQRPLMLSSDKVKELEAAILKKALAQTDYIFTFKSFSDELSPALVPVATVYNENWYALYATTLFQSAIDPGKGLEDLERLRPFFNFMVLARKLNANFIYMPTWDELQRYHDAAHVEALSKVVTALGRLATNSSKLRQDALLPLVAHGTVIIKRISQAESVTGLASDIADYEADVLGGLASPNSPVTQELGQKFVNGASKIRDEERRRHYDRLIDGSYGPEDLHYFAKNRYGEPTLDEAIKALAANPEKQVELAFAYYQQLQPPNLIYDGVALVQTIFKNANHRLTAPERLALLAKNISFQPSKPELAEGWAEFLNENWDLVRQYLSQADDVSMHALYKSFPVSENAVIEHMDYEGTADQIAVVELMLRHASNWKPEVKAAYARLFEKVTDRKLVAKWKRALSIFHIKNRRVFLESESRSRCALVLSKVAPGLASKTLKKAVASETQEVD